MKNHRFLWLRNRTTDNRKCEKARNIKEKRTIEMFSTVSKPLVARPSSPRDKSPETDLTKLQIPQGTQVLYGSVSFFVYTFSFRFFGFIMQKNNISPCKIIGKKLPCHNPHISPVYPLINR